MTHLPDTPSTLATTDREVYLDLAVIALGSVAICLWAQQLVLMTVLIPALIALRLVFWALWARPKSRPLVPELLFFGICIALGAFNDWNSVVRHEIYEYTAPHFFPGFSSIPIWMLLFWGLIVRLMATVAAWGRLAAVAEPNPHTKPVSWRKNARIRIIVELILLLATRQAIYRLYLDPIFSWLPFLGAIAIFFLLFPPSKAQILLVVIAVAVGTVVEVVYIQIGDLHWYHHGWVGGVPLWIMLWWALAILIWRDVSVAIRRRLVLTSGS